MLLSLAALLPGTVQAQRSISNVATVDWDNGTARFSRSSNRVDIAVEPAQSVPDRVDNPTDHSVLPLAVSKTASVAVTAPGNVVQYLMTIRNPDLARGSGPVAVNIRLPHGFRLRPDTLRLDGIKVSAPAHGDGRSLDFVLPSIAAGGSSKLSYLAEVLGSAREGDTVNRAQATGAGSVASAVADASSASRAKRSPQE